MARQAKMPKRRRGVQERPADIDAVVRAPARRSENRILQLVTLAMSGANQAQMIRETGMDRDTVRRLLATTRYQQLLHEAERDTLDRIGRQIASAAGIGVRTLVGAATSESAPWSARVSAAKVLVELAVGTKVRLAGVDGEPVQVQVEHGEADALDQRIARMTERMQSWDESRVIEARSSEAIVVDLPAAGTG